MRCPCCYYLTLTERGGYEICEVCWWEDDGQDDETAEEAWGGPNSDLSLSQGRYNFARIGASDWTALKHKTEVHLPARVPGFPFAAVEALADLPPLKSWPNPWTISFHLTTRDPSTRWREAVRFLSKHGFQFAGGFEWKTSDNPEWAHPRFMRYVEHGMTVEIDQMFSLPGRMIVGAWFSTPAGGGARLKFQSVWQFRETWNEPAISINAYVPDEQASALFEDLIQEGSLLIANCSPTSWGLATVAEMTGEFPHVTQMVHGRTYFKESVAQRDLVDGFQRRAGPDRVHQVPSGVMLVGNRWRAGTVEEREVHGFLQEELRRLAMTIMSNQGRPV